MSDPAAYTSKRTSSEPREKCNSQVLYFVKRIRNMTDVFMRLFRNYFPNKFMYFQFHKVIFAEVTKTA